MGDRRCGLCVVAVDVPDPGVVDVVLPVRGPMTRGGGPGEGRAVVDGRDAPWLAVVIEFGELSDAAVATPQALGTLHTLGFVSDGAALDDAGGALGLAARR